MIFEKVLSTINKYNLIQKGDKVVLGLSGGPDSICLLHILNRLKEDLDIELYAAHLNHQIRGIEAQKDALYVSNMCDEMGITCFLKSIDVPKYCKDNSLSIEEGARKLRYEMFEEIKSRSVVSIRYPIPATSKEIKVPFEFFLLSVKSPFK